MWRKVFKWSRYPWKSMLIRRVVHGTYLSVPIPSHPFPWDVFHGIPIGMTFPWTSLGLSMRHIYLSHSHPIAIYACPIPSGVSHGIHIGIPFHGQACLFENYSLMWSNCEELKKEFHKICFHLSNDLETSYTGWLKQKRTFNSFKSHERLANSKVFNELILPSVPIHSPKFQLCWCYLGQLNMNTPYW